MEALSPDWVSMPLADFAGVVAESFAWGGIVMLLILGTVLYLRMPGGRDDE